MKKKPQKLKAQEKKPQKGRLKGRGTVLRSPMGKKPVFALATQTFATNLLALLLQNIALAGLGDAGGLQPSAVPGNAYVSLHTAPVGAGGNQSTNEATYTGYARIPLVRSNVGWTLGTATIANALQVLFGACTAGSETITDFAVGFDLNGAGQVIATGALDTPLPVSSGVQPQFAPGDLTVTVT